MQLYFTHASPYARSTRIVLREQRLEQRVQEVVSHPFNNAEDFIATNPLGKVPCLSGENGEAMMDSEVICAYLDRELGDGRLSQAMEADWELKTFYSVCSGLLDTLVLLRLEKLREKEGLRSDFWWQRYENAIQRTLDYLERRAGQLPEPLNLAHINLACALAYLDFRHSEIDWRSRRPQLADLAQRLESRDSFAATALRE
ncbi:glutathione S-transferase [Microbulbifer donghaiensis]|uniref:Glutathione S-transferase n=1 Tax=Microbulbifer donghaiensis TaxID=494016 RepID=A0A1M4Z813_9GAMM|nr:glutathione S-transferase N-terminal domain-containing protein [Microbulbifer donghaiensis]SHF14213.1 glutathione S-transferase [Microbulbifer donghaiensis]